MNRLSPTLMQRIQPWLPSPILRPQQGCRVVASPAILGTSGSNPLWPGPKRNNFGKVKGYLPFTSYFTRSLAALLLILSCTPILSQPAQSGAPAETGLYGRTIREIRILGLHHTRQEIILDQLTSRPGAPYTEESAAMDHRWMDRLKLFSSIRIIPAPVEEQVILTIEVEELARFLAYPSINVTGENGVSLGLGMKVPSLLHRAIAFSASARFGPLAEVEMGLQSPWRLRRKDWFDLSYHYRDRPNELDHFTEQVHEFEFRGGLKFRKDWRVGGRFALISLKSDQPGITLSADDRDRVPTLGAVLEYDGRDLRSNPHRGWQTAFQIGKNGGRLGGSADYATAVLDIRRYQPLADGHVLAFFSFATLQTGEVGKDVPLYGNYHIGGTNSLRGWQSDARQGNNQFLNTVEYRYEALPPQSFRIRGFNFYLGVQLAVFADLSTAWDRGQEFTGNMVGGGGFGIRLIVPFVDMIRLDFAFGQSGEGMISHFGVRDKADYARLRIR